MHEDSTCHCINPGCAHALPRPVAYCPYCGTAQNAQIAPAEQSAQPAPAAHGGDAHRAAVAMAAASAAASVSGWADAPQGDGLPAGTADLRPDGRVAAEVDAEAEAARASPPPHGSRAPAPDAGPRAPANARAAGATPTPDVAFGHSARAQQAPPPPAPPVAPPVAPASRGWGRGPAPPPAAPRGREPVRLRWWLLVLVLLWGVWLWAKPSARRIEKRIDAAIALAHACKAHEAQDELIALRADRATPQQLERLQQALNDEAAACTRRKRRAGSHPLAAPDR